MSEKAEAVSATLTSSTHCTIEITNSSVGYCLIGPKVYMSSGYCKHPPQPTIRTSLSQVCSFEKEDLTPTGAVGLLTYDLFHKQSRVRSQRMAIMFSVPYDRNLYKNRLAVGLFEQTVACDESLYKKMYEEKEGKESSFKRLENSSNGIKYVGFVDVRATMSTTGKAIVKVDVCDKMED